MKTDPFYEAAIDGLIPLAEREAKKKVMLLGTRSEERVRIIPGKPGKKEDIVVYNYCFFTEFFHKAMKRLAIENELRTF